MISFGAFVFGTGLIVLTGGLALAPLIISAVGFGLIVGGAFYIKNIGDRLYESTELMNLYLDGNEEAGEYLKLKAGFHVMGVGIAAVGMDLASKGISAAFAKTQLGNKIGSYFANAFEGTKYGVDGALDILNSISPKYTETLTTLIDCSGKGAADFLCEDKATGGLEEIEETLEIFDESSGKLTYNGDGTWTSNEGIIYGQGSAQGNRVLHILEHLKPNPAKPTHTLFNVDKSELIGLIDEAWVIKGTGTLQPNGNAIFEVDMGRVIGTNGEDTIIIITKGFTNEIVTAYPKAI